MTTKVEDAIAWIESTLKVPNGPLRGQAFRLDGWQREFLHEATAPNVLEAGLSISRKNGKTGLIGCWLLAHLCKDSPLHQPDWRAVVVSLTGDLAKEIRLAIRYTAEASGLADAIQIRVHPPPGTVEGADNALVTLLASDKASGHAVGADLVIVDEAGLLRENARDLWEAVQTAAAGRDGRLWAIGVQARGELLQELRERAEAGNPGSYWREYSAPEGCKLLDKDAWTAANPAMASGVVSESFIGRMAARAMETPANEPAFRSLHLNQRVDPEAVLILTGEQWRACQFENPPELSGTIYLGLDLGGSKALCSLAAYARDTGRLQVWGAFGHNPTLRDRAVADRCGELYQTMARAGELSLSGDRLVDIQTWLPPIVADLGTKGRIAILGCDRYRAAEARQELTKAGLGFIKWEFRGTGHSARADGSHDVRAFQSAALTGRLKTTASPMLGAAIANTALVFDSNGNPKLAKNETGKGAARNDALSAAVIAVGLAAAKHAPPTAKEDAPPPVIVI